jgi:hypothetical protein
MQAFPLPPSHVPAAHLQLRPPRRRGVRDGKQRAEQAVADTAGSHVRRGAPLHAADPVAPPPRAVGKEAVRHVVLWGGVERGGVVGWVGWGGMGAVRPHAHTGHDSLSRPPSQSARPTGGSPHPAR